MSNKDMDFKSFTALGFQDCVGKKWTHDDFSDFMVVVEDQEFHCHKFILSACSTLFDGLLRAEMRENLESRAVLKSMSKETFSVIMNAVYKGENGLTDENIIPVWHASCFLDIPFLTGMCEHFVCNAMSLTNFEVYFENAKLLGSKSVETHSRDFMLRNFQNLKDTKTFLEQSVDELCNMFDSHFLKVDSEDVVIEAILEWINYKPHEENLQINKIVAESCIKKDSSQLDYDDFAKKRFEEENSDTRESEQSTDRNNDTCTKEQFNELNNNTGANKQPGECNNDTGTNEQSSGRKNDTGRNKQHGDRNNDTSTNDQSSEHKNDACMETQVNDQTIENISDVKSKEPNEASSSILNSISISSCIEVEEIKKLELVHPGETQKQRPKLLKDTNDHKETSKSELILKQIYFRENHIVKLLKTARMFLLSRGCLENLTRNSMITSNPDALSAVIDALMYKHKALNYRDNIVRYRECSDIVNGVAYIYERSIIFYDLLGNCEYELRDLNYMDGLPEFFGITAVGSNLCFTTKKVEMLPNSNHSGYTNTDFKYFKLYNTQNNSLCDVGKSPDTSKTFLLNYCEIVECVDSSHREVSIIRNYEEHSMGLNFVHSQTLPTHTTIIEDIILIFYNSLKGTGIKRCTPGHTEIVFLRDIDGPAENMTSFHNGKYLYLLQRNGNLLLVTRSQTDDIEFTLIDKLWQFEWNLHGAVCYNKTLFIFGEGMKGDYESSDNDIKDLQKRSLPDVFESIKVINIKCKSQVVPVAVRKSILRHKK